ncbi:MAG: cbb3-type cytochrome c oxidase subunit I [Deltaproteobacteria bacterium]|nr:MAG: cbb3-type cytochrome c oxidase subunit I [Deltaproteobacteria bacterium]
MTTAAAHAHPESFLRTYVFSTDHKTIAKQYLVTGIFMGIVGGLLSYVIRMQLANPGQSIPGYGVIGPQQYNALVTMHGTIMIFWVAMPILLAALANFLIPLMIGAKDMAFPRLNMMSFWVFFLSTVVLLVSFFVPGGAAAGGWTSYPPLSGTAAYSGGQWGVTLWLLAVALEFVAFLMGGINFITTAINLRAPGMRLFDMPLMVWMQVAAAVIFLFSVGPLIAGALLLLLDRLAGTGFYAPAAGGDPILFQHLFWFFGHPEVYVILLPGFGVIAEILPVFSRKPIFGYRMIVYATIITGILSFIVWAHHQFIAGIDPRLATPFSITTILISVPVAVILFSFIATLYRGSIELASPMLFALGTLAVFLLGGVTGIHLGVAATDIYFHDTYFVVAHFHYTLIPPVAFGFFAASYFWFPKMFGRMLNERLAHVHFWLTFVFMNLTFLPQFKLGFMGHQRRIVTPTFFEALRTPEVEQLQSMATVGAVCLLLSQILFFANVAWSLRRGEKAAPNPWRANTLEWTTPSPPGHGNFDTAPVVYRGPYEYSPPGRSEDWFPQNLAPEKGAGS